MSEIPQDRNERQNVETFKPSKSVLLRKDGRRLKRTTIYLPVDLARQLAHHCVESDSDVSATIALAISRYLTFSK